MTEDINIINDVLSGDIDAFKLLIQRYQKPVLSMTKNITNDYHTAQDIAQDTFFAAYKKLHTFDQNRSSFSTWLFTIAKNKSINALRKKKPIPADNLPENIDSANPADNLSQKEFFNKLDTALQRLPVKLKTAFVLAEFQNLTHSEIAKIEGAKTNTIKTRVFRAKEKLRLALNKLDGELI